jgi:hypothetical protein
MRRNLKIIDHLESRAALSDQAQRLLQAVHARFQRHPISVSIRMEKQRAPVDGLADAEFENGAAGLFESYPSAIVSCPMISTKVTFLSRSFKSVVLKRMPEAGSHICCCRASHCACFQRARCRRPVQFHPMRTVGSRLRTCVSRKCKRDCDDECSRISASLRVSTVKSLARR